MTATRHITKLGIIGSGFVARGLILSISAHPDYTVSKVYTRRSANGTDNYNLAVDPEQITNDIDDLIESSELVIECSGDVLHSTAAVAAVLKAELPVVTMDAELHVTTGSWLAGLGYFTEAEGDQPGSTAILMEDARDMGFQPLVFGNIKGFLNHTPTPEDMEYWSGRNGISMAQVTSFTDGTKLQIEQALVANGLGATIAQQGLIGHATPDLNDGAQHLAETAAKMDTPISDYLLSPASPPGVFLVSTHDARQKDYLRYYKLGDGPYYILVRPFHLCHLEILKTVRRTLDGGSILLNNSLEPQIGVAAIAKREMVAGESIRRGIGSFDVRGEAIKIADAPNHVPVGLVHDAVIKQSVEPGQTLTFDDIELPDSLALTAWKEIKAKVLATSNSPAPAK